MRTFALNPLLESIFFTSAITLSAGLGFGLALRSAPTPPPSSSLDSATQTQTGGGLLQSEQTFPPRPGWNLDSEEEGENLDGARYNSLQTQ
ncbi:MAG: hypothetical protein VKL20_01510 [Synechocystis sp.]|nr:hypothetical protein [Synechocystis sp.]